MIYLYIDESGDLGFSEKGSKYFILTCIKINDDKTNTLFKRIPKEVRERSLTKKAKKTSELKFSNSTVLIRERFLTRASKLDMEVYSLVIDKEFTAQKLRNNLPILYNYLIKILLERALKNIKNNEVLNIYLDKCMSVSQRENFENYIKTEFFSLFKDIPKLSIVHENSHNNEGLQVADFICGAFGYKYNTAKFKYDFDYYTNIIKNTILIEKNDLFKKQ